MMAFPHRVLQDVPDPWEALRTAHVRFQLERKPAGLAQISMCTLGCQDKVADSHHTSPPPSTPHCLCDMRFLTLQIGACHDAYGLLHPVELHLHCFFEQAKQSPAEVRSS